MIGLFGRKKLLSERQEALLERQRALLTGLRKQLDALGADVAPADLKTLDDTIAHLGELFLLVIAGEFNAGKSSFINALIGEKVVPEGVTPTTAKITVLRYGPVQRQEVSAAGVMECEYPAEVLRQIAVVDTPGTNAVIREHEELTREFIPRADLVLFVTSADRPFTESERGFLEAIRQWGKKILIVLNKVDLLETQEVDQVVTFIKDNARDLLGFTPEVFPLSARLAQRSRIGGDESVWKVSRFEAFERYVLEQLDEEERVRLKLQSPLGVAQRLTDTYLTLAEGRLATLKTDFETLDNIERQLVVFREDLAADFKLHQGDVAGILGEMELRGVSFFDETIRLGNILELRHSDRIKAAFDEQVIADAPQQIEGRMHGLIDWMIGRNLKVWQEVTGYLQRERVPEHKGQLIGEVGGTFDYNREELRRSVVRGAQQVVESYNREAEAQALADDVRDALVQTGLAQAGAVGFGALVLTLVSSAAVDITGVLGAGLIAVGGLYLIPRKRAQVKGQFHAKIDDLRERLLGTMQRQFDTENERMVTRVREAIGPYTRFIRSQREHLTAVQGRLSDADVDLGKLREEIGAG